RPASGRARCRAVRGGWGAFCRSRPCGRRGAVRFFRCGSRAPGVALALTPPPFRPPKNCFDFGSRPIRVFHMNRPETLGGADERPAAKAPECHGAKTRNKPPDNPAREFADLGSKCFIG